MAQITLVNEMTDNEAQTMSSREIADLCDKLHHNVMRDSRAMLAKLYPEGVPLSFEGYYIAENGKKNPCLFLPKRETLILVSGYDIDLRARIIDRWEELERAPHFAVPQTFSDALRLAAELNEEKQQLVAQITEDAPKVAFANKVIVAEDAITMGEAAKTLDTGRNRLMSYMRRIGWLNRKNEPYQAKIEAGLLDVKISDWDHPNYGLRQRITPLMTGKGLAKLEKLRSKDEQFLQ